MTAPTGLRGLRFLAAFGLFALLAANGTAERLPIRSYDSGDGLAHDRIKRIVRDPRGFLWFCTPDEFSRFDGYRFKSYGLDAGLPRSQNDLVITRDGTYWIATNGSGVATLSPSRGGAADRVPPSDSRFIVHPGPTPQADRVNVLLEDRSRRLWAGTDGGLFELDRSRGTVVFRRSSLGILGRADEAIQVFALLEDREGGLWIGTTAGLCRRLPDGRLIRYESPAAKRPIFVYALLQDRAGRIWIGHSRGLVVTMPETNRTFDGAHRQPSRELSGAGAVARLSDGPLRLPDLPGDTQWYAIHPSDLIGVRALYEASDGRVWVGTGAGIAGIDGRSVRTYTRANGLVDDFVISISEDRDGNLWLGSYSSGAMKIARNGFIAFDDSDGLPDSQISSLFESRGGELCAVSFRSVINRFDGRRFTAIRPNVPADLSLARRDILQDHAGEWWVATGEGLYRFPASRTVAALARSRPSRIYSTQDGLPGEDVRQLFEDSRGDLWVSSARHGSYALSRWERASGRFRTHVQPNEFDVGTASSFGEDGSGNLWIGFRERGKLGRYRHGRFEILGLADGIPPGHIRAFHLDKGGRLWLIWLSPTGGGLTLVDSPDADHPRFHPYRTEGGLLATLPSCVAADASGRMYLGTTRGVERLDPVTGRVKHFTTADGVIHMEVLTAFRDRAGALWFGTTKGVSRFMPAPDLPTSPPRVAIEGVRVGGSLHPVSELGETEITRIELPPGENQMQIDFFGFGFAAGERLRYQYKLEGADRDWGAPTDHRSVNYARLSSGSYRFLVRAINTDGLVSPRPATVAFTVLPPIFARGWFVTLAVALGVLVVHAFYRSRLRRLLELERVRTRIASDLHDDVGSSLSRIAIMSEVLQQKLGRDHRGLAEPLSAIAAGSRESVDSIGDIVWAIDPRRDSVRQLAQRMRRFASDLLAAREIHLDFHSPDGDGAIPLGAELRRELFLIFKESVHNVVRHSGCARAAVSLELRNGFLVLEVRDDGKGFDPASAGEGLGLASMRTRAGKLGGELRVCSPEDGHGTTVVLRVPIGRKRLQASHPNRW